MTREILAIVAIAAIVILLVVMLVVSHQSEQRRQAEYQALAKRRDCDFDFRPVKGHSPAELRFSSHEGGLFLVVTRKLSRKAGASTTTSGGHSVFRAADPRLHGGLAVYAPEMPKGVSSAAASLMGIFDNSLAKMILGKLLGDEIGDHLAQLQVFAAPEGVALTILATVDPNSRFDAAAIARAIDAAPRGQNDEARTMVLLNESGLQLRVGRALNEAREIEALLDTGLRLREELR